MTTQSRLSNEPNSSTATQLRKWEKSLPEDAPDLSGIGGGGGKGGGRGPSDGDRGLFGRFAGGSGNFQPRGLRMKLPVSFEENNAEIFWSTVNAALQWPGILSSH